MERGNILALDLASNAGFAYGEPGTVPRLWSVDFQREGDLHDFYGNLTAYIATLVRDNPIALFAIEEPIAPSAAGGRTNHDTTMKTIGGYGIVIGIIKCKKIPYQPVRVDTWRKHFTGKGRVTDKTLSAAGRRKLAKSMVRQRCRLLGWKADDDDAADAGGIWDWAGANFMGALPAKLHLFDEQSKGASHG